MSCKLAIIGLLCLVYCTGSVYAVLGAGCTGTAGTVGDCDGGNNEVCSADATQVCECDAATGYEVSSGDNTVCALKDCASDTDPTGYTNLGNTVYGQSATADCDGGNGYLGAAVLVAGACKVDGTWDVSKFSGCTLADCASDTAPTGYTTLANTVYGQSATADCDAGNGYSGTAVLAAGACKADGTWDVSKISGCTLADCTSASVDAGYLVTGTKTYGGTPTVACDAGSGYTGTAAAVTCGVNSQWSAFSGCSSSGGGGIDLGNACTNNAECTSGNGGSGSKCDTNCVCDATNSYVENSSTCKLATDLGNTCSANEECTLGNGGAGATCSTNCVCDEASGYTESGSTCTKNAGTNLLSMFNVVSMLAFILMVKLM